MGTWQKGSSRVGSIERKFWALGYRTIRASASGQSKGSSRGNKVPADIVAYAPNDSHLPHALVEVGGKSKSIRMALGEIQQRPLPAGHIALVARCMPNRRWRFNADEDYGFDDLLEALEHAGDAA